MSAKKHTYAVAAFLLGASPAYSWNEGHLNRLKTTGDCVVVIEKLSRKGCGLRAAGLRNAQLERAHLFYADLRKH
jgi:hypothetical protein